MNIKYGHIIKTHQNIKGTDTQTAAILFNECQPLWVWVYAPEYQNSTFKDGPGSALVQVTLW